MKQVVQITHSDGEHIQYVSLTEEEVSELRSRIEPKGFYVCILSVSDSVWPWILGEEDEEDVWNQDVLS